MSLRYIDGFEHGVLSTAGGGLYQSITEFGTAADFSTTVVKSGNRSLRMRFATRMLYPDFTGSPTFCAIAGWYRTEGIPVVVDGMDIFSLSTTGAPGTWIRLKNDGNVVLEAYDGTSSTAGTPGPVLAINTWYWIQISMDISANPWVVKAKVNNIDVATFSPAIPAGIASHVALWGNSYNEGADLNRYYDDVVIYAGSTSDYPIAPKRIWPKRINGVATHALEAATSKYFFKDVGGTKTFLTTSETDSYQTIDDIPLNQDADHVGIKGVNIGHDTAVESHTGTTGSVSQASFDISVALNARSRGVLVFTFNANSNANDATSVKINPASDNIDVPAVASSLSTDTATEPGSCRAWFVGSGLGSLPGTTVTVRVNRNNNANTMYAVVISILADVDLEVTGVATLNEDGTLAEQSVSDGGTLSVNQNSIRYAGVYSGLASVPAVGSNSTALQSIDFGNFVCATCRETNVGAGSRSVGFSSGTSDDRAYTVLAIRGVTPQADTSDYVEYTPENSDQVYDPIAVRTIAAMRQDTASACAVDTLGYDGTTETVIENDLSINSATNIYRATVLPANPSGGAWRNIDIDNLRLRWGKTLDPRGIPRLAAIQIEVLHEDIKRIDTFNRQDAQHRKSRW